MGFLKVCANRIDAMENGNCVVLGLPDLFVAFDAIDQDISNLIMHLFSSYGIQLTALNWTDFSCQIGIIRSSSMETYLQFDVTSLERFKHHCLDICVLSYMVDLGRMIDLCGLSSNL